MKLPPGNPEEKEKILKTKCNNIIPTIQRICISGCIACESKNCSPPPSQIDFSHRNHESNEKQIQHFHVFRVLNGRINTFHLKSSYREQFSENRNNSSQQKKQFHLRPKRHARHYRIYLEIRINRKNPTGNPTGYYPRQRVVMAVFGASNRSMDSITNSDEANGAAKAAANPAPAPADSNCFRSPASTLPHLETKQPT